MSFSLVSCDEETVNALIDELTRPTDDEVAQALRDALTVGAESSSNTLSAEGGYFNDLAVKIFLPEEAQNFVDAAEASNNVLVTTAYETALKPIVDDLVESLNCSAEDAAIMAFDIFKTAITEMTLTDVFNILQGSERAATDASNSRCRMSSSLSPAAHRWCLSLMPRSA